MIESYILFSIFGHLTHLNSIFSNSHSKQDFGHSGIHNPSTTLKPSLHNLQIIS